MTKRMSHGLGARLLLGIWLIGCGDDTPSPDAGVNPDAGASLECPPITGEGTSHQGTIDADETWTAAGSPHLITFNLSIQGATLTIEPCAEVRIGEGYHVTIGASTPGAPAARIIARGERISNGSGPAVLRQIRFVPTEAGTHWGSLRIFPSGSLDLEEVVLEGGGEQSTAQNLGGTIVATGGGGPTLKRMLRAVSVAIRNSGGFGVNLQSFGAFTEDSRDLTISGAGQQPSTSGVSTNFPIYVAPPAVQSIPTGTYTGNAVDEIQVFNQSQVLIDETFDDRGVPYRMQTTFSMSTPRTQAEGGLVTLTLAAGVIIKFNHDPANIWGISLGTSNGELPENLWPVRLLAQGTSEKPIVLTSGEETPAAGDWAGIEWRAGPSTGNIVEHLRIEYAGGNSGSQGFGCGPADNDAALIIANWRPETSFISNSAISDSAGGGIVSGWRTDEDGPNLKVGNTFTNIGNGCDVSRWSNVTAPACPGNDDIPDCL